MAQLFGMVQEQRSTVLTDIPRDVSLKSNLGFHSSFLGTIKWTFASIWAIDKTGIIVYVLAEIGCCKALGKCCSWCCALLTRRKSRRRLQISQPQSVVNRENLLAWTFPVNYTTFEDEAFFTKPRRANTQISLEKRMNRSWTARGRRPRLLPFAICCMFGLSTAVLGMTNFCSLQASAGVTYQFRTDDHVAFCRFSYLC